MGNPQNVIRPLANVPADWFAEVAMFRSYLAAGNISTRYLDECVGTIRRLAIDVSKPPAEVRISDLIARQNRGISAGSMATERAIYRKFFGMLWEEEMITRDPARRLPRVRVHPGKPRPFSVDQVELLLNGTPQGRPAYRRSRAMILLGALQGWRVAEISRATGEMFDLTENVVRYVAKGSKERVQPLHPIIRALAETMPRRGYWFPGQTGAGHVLPKSVSSLLANRISTVGIDDPRLTAHSLRHFYCTQLLRGGVDIRIVAEVAGHETTATTMRYTEVDLSQQFDAVNVLPTLQGNPHAAALAEAAATPQLENLRRNGPFASRHGTSAAYRTGCRCDDCRTAHAAANARWRSNRSARADTPPDLKATA